MKRKGKAKINLQCTPSFTEWPLAYGQHKKVPCGHCHRERQRQTSEKQKEQETENLVCALQGSRSLELLFHKESVITCLFFLVHLVVLLKFFKYKWHCTLLFTAFPILRYPFSLPLIEPIYPKYCWPYCQVHICISILI